MNGEARKAYRNCTVSGPRGQAGGTRGSAGGGRRRRWARRQHQIPIRSLRFLVRRKIRRRSLSSGAQRLDEAENGQAVLFLHGAQLEVRHDRAGMELAAVFKPCGVVHVGGLESQVGGKGSAPWTVEANRGSQQPFFLRDRPRNVGISWCVAVIAAADPDEIFTLRNQIGIRRLGRGGGHGS